tara:strand:- start:11 stop:1219 length:1209 start_codon:yes stop_codon:yes gene_type:complete
VLAADGSCREILRKFLAWLSVERDGEASPGTGAYCKARARLPLEALEKVHKNLANKAARGEGLWRGRRVRVIDGSSVSMPDTLENQERYPQPGTQKAGCGFPVMRVVAVFSLGAGVLLDLAKGTLKVSERTLFRQLWDIFEAGDIALADTGFCSYGDFYYLGLKGVDCVMPNHQARKVGLDVIKRFGKWERLLEWHKGPCPRWLSTEEWRDMPDRLRVREITTHIDVPGFRTKKIVTVTTLLDRRKFPKAAIEELYRRRWMAELWLRDIKIALGMDILRCLTPDMVEKELWMHLIAYNLIRATMNEAAKTHHVSNERISFKGTIATIRQWAPILAATSLSPSDRIRNHRRMLHCIAHDPVPDRPGRAEPRALKRRPKNYQRITEPRKQFKETPHRGKKRGLK